MASALAAIMRRISAGSLQSLEGKGGRLPLANRTVAGTGGGGMSASGMTGCGAFGPGPGAKVAGGGGGLTGLGTGLWESEVSSSNPPESPPCGAQCSPMIA